MSTQPPSTVSSPPNPTSVWLLAIRPRTLPAATAPVLVGAGVAFFQNQFDFLPALAALLGALLLQIGANLANDVYDYKKGADTAKRLGPTRVTQAGLLTPRQVMGGMWITFGLAALAGIYLIWVSGWAIALIGIASILAAIAYTGGPYPLGYNGLGEVFCVYFLWLCCAGHLLCTGLKSSALLPYGYPSGGIALTAILVVNNLRDLETDREAVNTTVAVRLGVQGTRLSI